MYCKDDAIPLTFENFYLLFGGRLQGNHRHAARPSPGASETPYLSREGAEGLSGGGETTKPGHPKIHRAVDAQLRYLRRNLRHINHMVSESLLVYLRFWQYRSLLVIHEFYRQQQEMFDHRRHTVADHIVSLTQPHLRPIVRGKARSAMGFGRYPESVHADQIYRTRKNRNYCRDRSIHLSGQPLGRVMVKLAATLEVVIGVAWGDKLGKDPGWRWFREGLNVVRTVAVILEWSDNFRHRSDSAQAA